MGRARSERAEAENGWGPGAASTGVAAAAGATGRPGIHQATVSKG